MADSSSSKHKKNLGGGKGHKKGSGKEKYGERHNRETTDAFVDDITSGSPTEGVTMGRVIKVFGGARMSLQTTSGEEIIAALKGNLRCSKGAARHADNATAVSPGCFVILQRDEVLTQVVGVLNRRQVKAIEKSGKLVAVRGFFDGGDATEEGFEWDLEEGGKEGDGESDSEVDVDAI